MKPRPTCSTCQRLRWFLMIALPLIAGIYLQPVGAVALAQYLPAALDIGLGICICGSIVFMWRLWRYAQTRH